MLGVSDFVPSFGSYCMHEQPIDLPMQAEQSETMQAEQSEIRSLRRAALTKRSQ